MIMAISLPQVFPFPSRAALNLGNGTYSPLATWSQPELNPPQSLCKRDSPPWYMWPHGPPVANLAACIQAMQLSM